MSTGTAARWRCHPNLAWREWDGEFVVFNDDDGNTHHLGTVGCDFFRILMQAPAGLDVETLLTIGAASDPIRSLSRLQVEDALDELARLGVIVRHAA